MSDLQTYLINLDRSPERLKSASSLLQGAGLPFERVSAVDGAELDLNNHPQHDPQKSAAAMGRFLIPGEVGCYLSHLNCLDLFLAGTADFCLILEDDFHAPDDGFERFSEVFDWLSAQPEHSWSVINLSRPAKKFWRRAEGIGPTLLQRAYYFPITTTALLWNRPGAKTFLNAHRNVVEPVDLALQYQLSRTGKGMACNPPPFPPRPILSDIGQSARDDPSVQRRDYQLRRFLRRWKNYGPTVWHYLSAR